MLRLFHTCSDCKAVFSFYSATLSAAKTCHRPKSTLPIVSFLSISSFLFFFKAFNQQPPLFLQWENHSLVMHFKLISGSYEIAWWAQFSFYADAFWIETGGLCRHIEGLISPFFLSYFFLSCFLSCVTAVNKDLLLAIWICKRKDFLIVESIWLKKKRQWEQKDLL